MVLELVKRCMVVAEAVNVVALSETMVRGTDFRLVNLLNAWMKASSDKSGTTSRCTALVDAQVKRQMYAFPVPVFVLTWSAPV